MRWISYSRVSMQRAGILLAVTASASESKATTLDGMSRAYSRLLRRVIPLPEGWTEDFLRHVAEQRLWKRYPELRSGSQPPGRRALRIELQDLWLADPRLSSSTGAITREVIDEPPQLAANVGFVREKNYTLTDRGRALGIVAEPTATAFREGDLEPNPFVLQQGACAFVLYSLLDADLDFVRAVYRAVLEDLGTEFTRPAFGECLPKACLALRSDWIRKARTGTLQRRLARLEKLAELIARPVSEQRTWGGGRPRDQTGTLRVEPYVDLGLITKPSRSKYRYRLSDPQRQFFEDLVNCDDSTRFLDERLFGSYLRSQAGTSVPEPLPSDEVWTRIRDAYGRMRSGLGYASFRDVVLLAIAQQIDDEGDRYFEVADGIRVIHERRQAEPQAVRFGVARGGALTYMKIMEARAR